MGYACEEEQAETTWWCLGLDSWSPHKDPDQKSLVFTRPQVCAVITAGVWAVFTWVKSQL